MNLSFSQLLNNSLELITLAGVLILLSKMILESFQVRDWGKRIPPEKASLCGQRRVRRA